MKSFTLIAAAVLALVTYTDAQRNRAPAVSTDAGTKDEILELEKKRQREHRDNSAW